MLKYVKKVLYILGADKAKAFFLIPFFLLSSLVEIIGIGLIVPYVSLIINPEKLLVCILLKKMYCKQLS